MPIKQSDPSDKGTFLLILPPFSALKVSVRTTEVVRPVLQHLYATRAHFRAPIIVHAVSGEQKRVGH